VAFGTTVDWTVRLAVTAQLLRTRRWSALAGWAATVALGEISVGPLKAAVDRPRPDASMTRTSMASYPSGHALAAATTAPGIVIALLPAGPARRRLLAVAVPLAAATSLSRTFLNAHWLSDVVGGFADDGGRPVPTGAQLISVLATAPIRVRSHACAASVVERECHQSVSTSPGRSIGDSSTRMSPIRRRN